MRISDWSSDVCSSDLDPPLRIEAAQCGQIKHCGKAHLMPFAQHGDMRADDPPAFGKTHPALRLPSRCRCPDPLEFGVGGCEIRPETGDDRFQQAARWRSAATRRPERLDRRETVKILAGAEQTGRGAERERV